MTAHRPGRLGFSIKPPIAIALVALADTFFFGGHVGSTVGVFALTLVAVIVFVHAGVRRDPRARVAVTLAAVMAAVLFNAPSVQGWLLYWTALTVAVLSPRAGPCLDALTWSRRLGHQAFFGMIGPVRDGLRLRGRLGLPRGTLPRFLAIVAIPAIGGAVFLSLFASANPIIDQVVSAIRVPDFDIPRVLFWLVCLQGVWSFLRPRFLRRGKGAPAKSSDRPIPGISVASVGLSLGVFNALFALQNGLDIAFLWSGAALPKGVTLAEYAHRGAYPLIATALLAGVFVLVALRPDSATARQPWLRGLVVLWVAQNVFLVASSILRTLDYVEAYSLTRLRIAALLWMGLVAVGLMLICWRLLRRKTSGWLINANVLAAGLVFAGCSVVDLGGVAAQWNVDHAREVGGDGPPLDLCYLTSLSHSSIVVPLSDLERRPLSPTFRDRVSRVRSVALQDLKTRQAQWRSWTWRDERRFERAKALYPDRPSASAISVGA
jgi:hypothetical protein